MVHFPRKSRQAPEEGGPGAASSKSSGLRGIFSSGSRHASPSPVQADKKPPSSDDTAAATSASQPAVTEAETAKAAESDKNTAQEGIRPPANNEASPDDKHEALTTKDASPTKDAPSTQDASHPHDRYPGVLGSAYHKARQSLTPDEQKDTSEDGMRQLLVRLDAADEQDQKDSLLRRGIAAVGPHLGPVKATLDFVGLFAGAEPIAGTAIGIVKGVASFGIAISSAAEDLKLTLLVGGVLELVPVLETCDRVVGESSDMEGLHTALCDVYKDLLQFYLKATRLLKRSNFLLRIAMNLLQPELPDILASFNKHSLVLSRLVDAKTFAMVQEIKDEQVETLIRDTLDINRANEIAYYNELKHRADEACQWITSVDEFKLWQLNLDNFNLLAMFGDMGCGKTMTTGYVMDYLSKRKQVVCGYYCKSDQETTSLGNIYRSLVWQMLQRRPELKPRYSRWYKRTERRSQVNPAQSESHLQEFLTEAITSSEELTSEELTSGEWTFIVLDGLDECQPRAQKQLLGLLTGLIDRHARLKVFVSARDEEDIVSALPKSSAQIGVPSSKERDRLIAAYLVDHISNISQDIREQVVNVLAEKAEGSAIWLRIAVEYLEKFKIKTPNGLQSHLVLLPLSKGLSELYWDLYSKICSDTPEIEDRVRRALEMLAVARRPLSPVELSYAVLFDPDEDPPVTTVAHLAELVQEVDLLELIRPFVTVIAAGTGTAPSQLRLVHQSLKEIILQAPPTDWETMGKVKSEGQNTKRRGKLDGVMLRQCVKYLLLEECGTNELPLGSGNGVENANELNFLQTTLFDDENEADDEDMSIGEKPGKLYTYDPNALGFGGFFVYAAVYWTQHFGYTKFFPKRRPDPDDLLILGAKGSRRMANWQEQRLRPRCTYQSEEHFTWALSDLDPLGVAAIFGPAESVVDMLSRTADQASMWRAVGYLATDWKIEALKTVVQDQAAGKVLCTSAFFFKAMFRWQWYEPSEKSTREWEETFEFVIQRTRDKLLEEGNLVLCRAAAKGCLPLVKMLFKIANGDPELKAAILSVNRPRGVAGLGHNHQSVGVAVYEAQTEMLRFLCAQPGIEPHLYYVDDSGWTVFHQAARMAEPEVFRILIDRWPDGLNQKDKNGDSPIQGVVYNGQGRHRATTETIRELIATGAADVTGRTDEDGSSPLCCAVKQGNVELCRVLVVEGSADMACAVVVDPETGKPRLRPAAVYPFIGVEEREKMLKDLCSLLPLAVSTEYLF